MVFHPLHIEKFILKLPFKKVVHPLEGGDVEKNTITQNICTE